MIYITIPTRNRFWHFALSMLALANAERGDAFVHLIDDATDDGSREGKTALVDDLLDRGIVNRVDWLPRRLGINALHARFTDELFSGDFSHRLHMDDDLAYTPDVLARAVADYDAHLAGGLLFLFVNRWCQPGEPIGDSPLRRVPTAGGAAWLMATAAHRQVGNVFAAHAELSPQAAHEKFWDAILAAGQPLAIRYRDPYRLQHTANDHSVLNGRRPEWEHLWSIDYTTGKLIDVPEFPTHQLRAALAAGRLAEFTRAANERLPQKIKLPN